MAVGKKKHYPLYINRIAAHMNIPTRLKIQNLLLLLLQRVFLRLHGVRKK